MRKPRFARFEKGKSLRAQLTADRLNSILDFIEWLPLGPGVGYRLRPGTQQAIEIIRQDGGGVAEEEQDHPFRLIKRRNAADTGWEAGVIYESSLFKTLQPNNKQVIEGLLAEDRASGWFATSATDAIWLGVTFDQFRNVTWAGIDNWYDNKKFQLDKAAWSHDDAYLALSATTPRYQIVARKLIAYMLPADDGTPEIHQVMRADQVLLDMLIDGLPALYMFDHEGGYPL